MFSFAILSYQLWSVLISVVAKQLRYIFFYVLINDQPFRINNIPHTYLALKRKLSLDGGKTFKKLLEKMKKTAFDCKNANLKDLSTMGGLLEESITSLESSASWLTEELNKNPDNSAAGATPFLNMFGWILGGWVMCKASLTIEKNSLNKELGNQFCNEKINTSLFFCTTYLPTASALMSTIKHSHKSLSVIC